MEHDLQASDISPARSSHPSDVITTNNLVLQASRALDTRELTLRSLYDLSALIEAVVLHEHLLFLGTASQFDLSSLPLGKLLAGEGIFQDFIPPVSVQEVQEHIFRLFGIPDAYEKVSANPLFTRSAEASVLPYYGDYDFFSPNHISTMNAELDLAGKLPPFGRSLIPGETLAETLPHYCFSLVEMWAGSNAWARRPAQAFLVRTLVYWLVADRVKIPFYPDVSRIPIVAHITHHLQESLAQEAAEFIAQAFYLTPQELEKSVHPFEFPIPPLTTLVLERAGSLEDVGQALLEVRSQFQGLREQIGAYQYAINFATSLGDLVEARQTLCLESMRQADAYRQPDKGRIQEITNYYQRALYSNRSPGPLSYKDEVLFKPPEWLRKWWVERNAIYICDIGQELESMDILIPLAGRLFPGGMQTDDLADYRSYTKSLAALYY
jgi:hypothetical protein